jgi:DNA repair protein RadA/Sms
VHLHDQEIYLNVVGGWRLDEPGSDLPVALAIASSVSQTPLGRLAAWGEIGLAGEVRSIPFESRRIEELRRLGLERWVAPQSGQPMRLETALDLASLGP